MSTSRLDETHDPNLKSWVESANDPATDFPIQNLPLCAMLRTHDDHSHRHLGVVIGDQILDISMLIEAGMFADGEFAGEYNYLARAPFANIIGRSAGMSQDLRRRVQRLLRADVHVGQQAKRVRQKAVSPLEGTPLLPAVSILNYTDFYASKHHATNVGAMFRPDNPLLPNYKHIPIAYHGRASSIIVSGTPVTRPSGQFSPPEDNAAAMPTFGPCKMLDYELELGVIVGEGTQLGKPFTIDQARAQMFGMCIVNDWSSRDVQKWEYQPLGPFLAKNFATTISPLVVTMEALEPFRIPGPERDETDPQPLEYLRAPEDWGLDITVEAWLSSQQMRDRGTPAHRLTKGSFKHMYWTIAQMLTHHASGGCNLQPGDLLASGTISGPSKDSRGCLLELTWDGLDPATKKPKPRVPVQLPTGETRTFLADGDEVILKAYCERDGYRRIGFGECRGIVVAREI
ncbi:MAG: fumarylacetoacetase [Pyrinomonadaceae bacterium]|nr:fumarylacetoacetase [Phycisphaerales bacterium]